ncbi:hypothetical protein ABFS83_14G314800 [Erythranthe nasuta]
MPNNKGVIIKVYVESRKLRSDQKTDPIKKLNPKRSSSKPRVFETGGYSRRAQLLAYSQELRHVGNAPQPQKSRRKPNKWKWALHAQKKIRVTLFSRFNWIKKKWKYEPIVSDEEYYSDVEGSCNRENTKGRRRYSHCCKRLRCFLKQMCRAWKCKNGGC